MIPDASVELSRISRSFPFRRGILTPEGIRHYAHLREGKVVLDIEQYPLLVHFKDLNDPKSVEDVYEREGFDQAFPNGRHETHAKLKSDNFEKIFGPGVKLKDITLEMSDDSLTQGVVGKYLPWLGRVGGGYLSGRFSSTGPELSGRIDGGYFIRR